MGEVHLSQNKEKQPPKSIYGIEMSVLTRWSEITRFLHAKRYVHVEGWRVPEDDRDEFLDKRGAVVPCRCNGDQKWALLDECIILAFKSLDLRVKSWQQRIRRGK